MSRLPPVPPASRPAWGPDAVPKSDLDVAHSARHRPRHQGAAPDLARETHDDAARGAAETPARGRDGRAQGPAPEASLIAGLSLPALKLGIAGFAGYVLGYIVARRR